MAEQVNKIGDIDAWFASLTNDEPESSDSSLKLSREGFFINRNGLMVPVSHALAKMRSCFEQELLPFDPSFCTGFAADADQRIAYILGLQENNYIRYPSVPKLSDFPPKNPDYTFSIWIDTSHMNWANNTNHLKLGRTLARTSEYDLVVDRYFDDHNSVNFQAMLRRFRKEVPAEVEAVLFLDVMSDTPPYQNAFLFSTNEDNFEEFRDVFNLQNIKRSLFKGFGDIAGMETPVM